MSIHKVFHLVIYAFFKAIIFISVGNLIHLSLSYQALKNRGSLRIRAPLNRRTLMIARIKLCGPLLPLPFLKRAHCCDLLSYSPFFIAEIGRMYLTSLQCLV